MNLDLNRLNETLNLFCTPPSIDIIEKVVNEYIDNYNAMAHYCNMVLNCVNYKDVVEKLCSSQFIYFDYIDAALAYKLRKAKSVDRVMLNLYSIEDDRKIKEELKECEKSPILVRYKSFFKEVKTAFNNDCYWLAIVGLFSIIDGVLCDVSKYYKTNFDKRINRIENNFKNNSILAKNDISKISKNKDIVADSIFILTFKNALKSFFCRVDRVTDEKLDKSVNRHEIVHSINIKEYNKIDFIKVLNVLMGIIKSDDILNRDLSVFLDSDFYKK